MVAEFNGGAITSDGGVLLLKEVETKRKIIKQFAACFTDHRDPKLIEHTVEELVGRRIFGVVTFSSAFFCKRMKRRRLCSCGALGSHYSSPFP